VEVLDAGTLTRIDWRLFAELDHTGRRDDTVEVPVSDAVWSAWWRYCEAIGLSMGERVAGLIAHELDTGVSDGARAGQDASTSTATALPVAAHGADYGWSCIQPKPTADHESPPSDSYRLRAAMFSVSVTSQKRATHAWHAMSRAVSIS